MKYSEAVMFFLTKCITVYLKFIHKLNIVPTRKLSVTTKLKKINNSSQILYSSFKYLDVLCISGSVTTKDIQIQWCTDTETFRSSPRL